MKPYPLKKQTQTSPASIPRRMATRLGALQKHYSASILQIEKLEDILTLIHQFDCAILEEGHFVRVEKKHFLDLCFNAWKDRDVLDKMVLAKSKSHFATRDAELILKLILRLGTYEILHRPNLTSATIISAWLNVTGYFFDGDETKLVNALLDKIAQEAFNKNA